MEGFADVVVDGKRRRVEVKPGDTVEQLVARAQKDEDRELDTEQTAMVKTALFTLAYKNNCTAVVVFKGDDGVHSEFRIKRRDLSLNFIMEGPRSPPCYLHLNRHLSDRNVRKLVWRYLDKYDRLMIRIAHGAAVKLKWLLGLSKHCASHGYLGLLKWTYREGLLVDKLCPGKAARHGHLPTLQWLCKVCDFDAYDVCFMAAKGGHVHVMEYCYEKTCVDMFTAGVAAKNGHIEMLDWLDKKDCSLVQVAYWAAEGGRVNVLEWAHTRGLRFDISVLCNAVSSGQVCAVQWLLDHGHSNSAVTTLAAKYGCNNILELLRKRGFAWTGEEFKSAALNIQMDTLEWLLSHGCPWGSCTVSRIPSVYNDGVIAWLRAHGCPE